MNVGSPFAQNQTSKLAETLVLKVLEPEKSKYHKNPSAKKV